MPPKVYIVVLNWNNWRDTLECLESVCRLRYPAFEVILCDNASTDGSVDAFLRWAEGSLPATMKTDDARLRALVDPPVAKPIAIDVVDADGRGGSGVRASITLVRVGENRGYAAGNNAGMRVAARRGDAQLFWILNNDTVVDPEALTALVRRVTADTSIGLCGSLLLCYDRPDVIQAAGGARYRRTTAIPAVIASGTQRETLPPAAEVEGQMSYVVGASMLVTTAFLEAVGPMGEDYFLYFEELDWVMRAKGRFKLAFAADSVVYHKEGATAGSTPDWRARSAISDLCAIRNRLLITRRYFRRFYPIVFATIIGVMLRRLWRGQPARAREVARMLRDPESYRLPLPGDHAARIGHGRVAGGERGIRAEEEEKRERRLDDQ